MINITLNLLKLDFRRGISDLMSDEIVDKLPPLFKLMRLLFGYRFHRRACRRLIVSRRDSESNQKLAGFNLANYGLTENSGTARARA